MYDDPVSTIRGCGAAGSAPHWQCGGQGFESPQLHPGKSGWPASGQPLFRLLCRSIGAPATRQRDSASGTLKTLARRTIRRCPPPGWTVVTVVRSVGDGAISCGAVREKMPTPRRDGGRLFELIGGVYSYVGYCRLVPVPRHCDVRGPVGGSRTGRRGGGRLRGRRGVRRLCKWPISGWLCIVRKASCASLSLVAFL